MNALVEAINVIDNLTKKVTYLENHLSPEKWDEYCEWWEEEKKKNQRKRNNDYDY